MLNGSCEIGGSYRSDRYTDIYINNKSRISSEDDWIEKHPTRKSRLRELFLIDISERIYECLDLKLKTRRVDFSHLGSASSLGTGPSA